MADDDYYDMDTYEQPKVMSWPGVVGSDANRAKAIVRSSGNYHVEIQVYKQAKKALAPSDHNPWRVILYVDKDGFVAITPRVG